MGCISDDSSNETIAISTVHSKCVACNCACFVLIPFHVDVLDEFEGRLSRVDGEGQLASILRVAVDEENHALFLQKVHRRVEALGLVDFVD